MYRKTGYILARIAGLLAVLLLGFLVGIQTPYVQTRLSKVALNQLAAIMDGRIQYDELKVMTSGVLVVRNIKLIDSEPYTEDIHGRGWAPADTVFRAEMITATFSLQGLIRKEGLHLGRVTIRDGYFHLTSEPGEYSSNIARIFHLKPKGNPFPTADIFDIKKLFVSNLRFRMDNYQEDRGLYPGFGINYENMDLTANVRAHNIRMSGGKISAVCDRASATEKSGYRLEHFSGIVEVGGGKALIEDLRLRDPWSDLSLRNLTMAAPSMDALSRFIEEVRLEGEFRRSQLALQTIAWFGAAALADSPLLLDIRRGRVRGYVNDLLVERLEFEERHSGLNASLEGRLLGLPDIHGTLLDVRVRDLLATTAGISRLINAFSPDGAPDLGHIARNLPMTLQARVTGPLDRLELDGTLRSDAGEIHLDGDLRNLLDAGRPLEAQASVRLDDLDLGRILGDDRLGRVSLYTRGSIGLRDGMPDALLDSLHIQQASLLGRELRDINASGSLQAGTLEARLLSNDPALRLSLTALADLTARAGGQRYRVDGRISEIDLVALGIETGGRISRITTQLAADLRMQGELMDGQASLSNFFLVDDKGLHALGDLSLLARTEGGEQFFDLTAPFLEASYAGNRPIPDFIADLQTLTVRRDLPALFTRTRESAGTGRYRLRLDFHDTRQLFALLQPGAYIADGTRLNLQVTDDGLLSGELLSDRLASGKNFLKDVVLRFDNQQDALFADLRSSELRAGNFAMRNPAVIAGADDNNISLNVHYDGISSAGGNAEILLEGQIYRDEEGILVVKAHPLNSFLVAGGDTWRLDESDIVLHGRELYLDRLRLSNGPQSLLVDGGLSRSTSDTLTLQMDRFDLALIDEFLPSPLGIEGEMNGRAFVASGSETGLLMDFRVDTLRLGGVDAGALQLSSIWNDEGKELGLFLRNTHPDRDAFYASGAYLVEDKRLVLEADLDRFPIGLAAPFLQEVLSDIGGGISGGISLSGPTDALSLRSERLRLEDVFLRPEATGVRYTVNGMLRLDDSGCHFDDLQIRDDNGGSGNLRGSIHYQGLKDFTIASQLSFQNLKVVDAPERPGSPFYGRLQASGSATLSGPFAALLIDANVSTAGDGNIHIPLSGSLSSSSSNLLTFTQPVRPLDPYEEMMAGLEAESRTPADIHIRGRLSVLPGTQAFVEIDKAAGNVASFNGQGTVNLNLQPARAVFDLNGDYHINEGNYQFVLPGILSKSFDIQRGSSVKFGGDLKNTVLDITAVYSLRTTLDALLGSTSSGVRRQVDCAIGITDHLSAPQVKLSVDIPDLDPSTRSMIQPAFSTDDRVQKQFVALLLMGNFLPGDSSSGVSNQTNMLTSNMASILSNQFNNIFQRLEIPIDVNFGYQEMYGGENLFDVSVSTQLFENRVLLGGSFGNRRYSTGSASGDIAGDLDMQVKLDPEGKFRFSVFSHSADEFTNYIDYSQRNGIGLSYQREYRSLGHLLRSIFMSRKKREERERRMSDHLLEPVTIQIENEDESGEVVPDPDAARP